MIGIASHAFIIFLVKRIGKYLATCALSKSYPLTEKLASSAIENFQSPIEIRAYNLENKQMMILLQKLKELFKLNLKVLRFSLVMSPSIEFISGH